MRKYQIEGNGTQLIISATGPFDAVHRLFNFFNIDPRWTTVSLQGETLTLDCSSDIRASIIFGKHAEFTIKRVFAEVIEVNPIINNILEN